MGELYQDRDLGSPEKPDLVDEFIDKSLDRWWVVSLVGSEMVLFSLQLLRSDYTDANGLVLLYGSSFVTLVGFERKFEVLHRMNNLKNAVILIGQRRRK